MVSALRQLDKTLKKLLQDMEGLPKQSDKTVTKSVHKLLIIILASVATIYGDEIYGYSFDNNVFFSIVHSVSV